MAFHDFDFLILFLDEPEELALLSSQNSIIFREHIDIFPFGLFLAFEIGNSFIALIELNLIIALQLLQFDIVIFEGIKILPFVVFGVHVDDLVEEIVDYLHQLGFLLAFALEHFYHLHHQGLDYAALLHLNLLLHCLLIKLLFRNVLVAQS